MTATPLLDPHRFDPDVIDPETREFNAKIEKLLSRTAPLYTYPPDLIRLAREAAARPALFINGILDQQPSAGIRD